MSNCLISCGNCSTLYLYIVYRIIFKGLKDFLLAEIFGIKIELNNHILIKSIYKYIGFLLFSFLFYTIRNKKNSNKNNKIKREKVGKKFNSELIYYKSNTTNFTMFRLIITCILYVLFLEFIEISYFYGFHDLDLWIFNIAFAVLFISKFYSIKIYRHHLYSLGFIFFTNFIILIIKSFQGDKENKNVYDNVLNIFPSKYFCFLIIFLYILNSFSISYTRVLTKILMEIKYISHYRIIFFIGAFGFILTFLFLIISSIFFPSNNINDEQFLGNFSIYCEKFGNNIWAEILVIPFYLFISFMEFNYEILIIYYLNPIYFLISDSLYYGLKTIILLICKPYENNNLSLLSILADAFAFLGYSIYVEAIILNFCDLNKNTKINIINRGILESENTENIIGDDAEEDDDDDYRKELNLMNDNISKK